MTARPATEPAVDDQDTVSAVVVGVDGSAGALVAAQWAAVEAGRRNLPLRLVFAVDPAGDGGGQDREASTKSRVDFAEDALAEAERRSRRVVDSVDVTAEVVHQSPAEAMVHAVSRTAMICLGSNGAHHAHPGHGAGTATEVLLTADCPVAVVRGQAPDHGWVVVRSDPEPTLFDTLSLAVNEAVLRGLSLRVVTPWALRDATPHDEVAELDRRLRQNLDGWRRKHPHLDAAVTAAPDLEEFLIRNSRRISMFVAPARRVHDVGTVIHPTAEAAVKLLECPVLICGREPRPTGGRGTHRALDGERAQGPGDR